MRKCYFGDYRFSQDLDFSGITGAPVGKDLETAMQAACRTAADLVDEYAFIQITCERYTEKHPHSGGQEAFTITRPRLLRPLACARHLREDMKLSGFASFLVKEKCAIKSVAFSSPDDFFKATMLTHVERTWAQWLGPLVPDLPAFDRVLAELRPQIVDLLGSTG